MKFKDFRPTFLIIACALLTLAGAAMDGGWLGVSYMLMFAAWLTGLLVSVSGLPPSIHRIAEATGRRSIVAPAVNMLAAFGFLMVFLAYPIFGMCMMLTWKDG